MIYSSTQKLVAWVFCLVLLCGCNPPLTAKRTVAKVGKVELAQDAYYQILPLQGSGISGTFNQKVTGVFQGQRQTFLSQVELDSEKMTMVGLATFGARIFTLQYEGEQLTFATIPQLSSKLLPQNLLADFQLVNWPVSLIQEQFAQSEAKTYWMSDPRKLDIQETPGHRWISFGGEKIIDITYSQTEDETREIVYKNLDKGYTLYISQFEEIEF